MISKQKSQLLVKQLEPMPRAGAPGRGGGAGAWGLCGAGGGVGGLPSLPQRALERGKADRSVARRAALRAPEMTVLAKGQVAAQIHSPAMRQLR